MKIKKMDLRIGKYIILVIVFVVCINLVLLNEIKSDIDRHNGYIFDFQASNVENLYKSYIANMSFYLETQDAIVDESLRSNTTAIINLFETIEGMTAAGELAPDHDDQDLWNLLNKRSVNEVGYLVFDSVTEEVLYENDYEYEGAVVSDGTIMDHFRPGEMVTVNLENGDVLAVYGGMYEPWQRGVVSFSLSESISLQQQAQQFVEMFKMDINGHTVKQHEAIYIIDGEQNIVFSNRSGEIGQSLELIDIKTGKDVAASLTGDEKIQMRFEYNDVFNSRIGDYYLFAYPMEDMDQMVIIVEQYQMGDYHSRVIRMTILVSIITILISSICIWLIYQNMYVYFEPMDINKK